MSRAENDAGFAAGKRPFARLAAALLGCALGLTSRVYAEPIKYKEVIKSAGGATGASPSGSLGAVQFGGANGDAILIFRFEGDTANVASFTTPVNGAENLVGVASVEVKNAATGALLARGYFLNGDGIFVSADNTNGGVGFGSGGIQLGATGFPGHPAYPYAIASLSPSGAIDLKSDVTATGSFVASCYNFPVGSAAACGTPPPLPTTAGDLVVNVSLGSGVQVGKFTARREEQVCRDRDDRRDHDDWD